MFHLWRYVPHAIDQSTCSLESTWPKSTPRRASGGKVGNGVAFTDEVKLVRKGNWLRKQAEAQHPAAGSPGPASRAFPALFDRISDPQIPLTTQKKSRTPA